MKKLLTLLISLCFVSIVSARPTTFVGHAGGYGAGVCTTPATGDEFNEGFVGTGYENSWTESEGTPDEDYTLSGSPPAASCSEGLHIHGVAAVEHTYTDIGDLLDRTNDTHINLDIYFNTMTLDNFQVCQFLNFNNTTLATADSVGKLRVQNLSGVYKIRASGSTLSDGVTVTVGKWYTVDMCLSGVSNESYMDVYDISGNSHYEVWFTRGDTNDGDKLHFSSSDVGTGEEFEYEIGRVYIDTP